MGGPRKVRNVIPADEGKVDEKHEKLCGGRTNDVEKLVLVFLHHNVTK